MAIREEPIRIEFHYEPEKAELGKLHIEYFSEIDEGKEEKYLKITPDGEFTEPHFFTVDFFVEVVNFLRGKGVLNSSSQVVKSTGAISTLPMPQIEGQTPAIADSGIIPEIVSADNSDAPPVISFTVPDKSSETRIEATVIDSSENAPQIDTSEIPINRKVIRTKVGKDDDPRAAVEESARLRGEGDGPKGFKRVEEE